MSLAPSHITAQDASLGVTHDQALHPTVAIPIEFTERLKEPIFQEAMRIIQSSKVARRAVDYFENEFRQATVSEPDMWAKRYRVMGEPFPGPWTWEHHPWTRDMLRSEAEENVGQKAAQMGFTEVVLNRALFTVVQRKRDVLYVLPAKTPDATDFSSGRFEPALELSSLLDEAFTSTKNIGHKRAGANSLYVRGSRARNHIKSIPCSLIVLDEVEEMTDEAIALAYERMSGQQVYQVWMISTPSVPGCGINIKFELSQQNHFFFKCPCCSRHTELIYPECLEITAEEVTDPAINNSYLKCKECGGKLPHETKPEWLGLHNAGWVATYPQRDIFGPHVSQLYSFARACHPSRLAKAAIMAQHNPADEQEFYNSKLGLPHIVAGSNISLAHVEECIGNYKTADPTYITGVLTLGIDVGKDCHYELVHWRFRESMNSVDINAEAKAYVIKAGKVKDFNELDEIMRKFKPRMTVIDDMPETRSSLAFARRWPGRVKLCHYSNGIGVREIIDHGERITVDRTTWLDQALSRFIQQTIVLPGDISQEYKTHQTALVRMYREHRISGERIALYRSTGPDHFGHSRNYSEIALKLAVSKGMIQSAEGRRF